ncbi:MAG: hypothetical protein ACI8T1_000308 [Verrucomicrobiales bacterium]|jgi:hypothetical protein
MTETYLAFTSHQKNIGEFLEQAKTRDHGEVVYMNFPPNSGVFEDQANRSMIFFENADENGETSSITVALRGEGGLIHEWVGMFRNAWGATVEG